MCKILGKSLGYGPNKWVKVDCIYVFVGFNAGNTLDKNQAILDNNVPKTLQIQPLSIFFLTFSFFPLSVKTYWEYVKWHLWLYRILVLYFFEDFTTLCKSRI